MTHRIKKGGGFHLPLFKSKLLISRVLFPKNVGVMIISLDRLLPAGSSDLTRELGRAALSFVGAYCNTPLQMRALLFGLAPGGVYHAFDVAIEAVSSYLAVSPLPGIRKMPGGLFSVALSLGSPPVAVSDHPALRSSDFPPPARGSPHPAESDHLSHFANRYYTLFVLLSIASFAKASASLFSRLGI